MAHARLSPSGAHRWSVCTASPHEEAGKPDNGNDAARWGTAAHLLSETCLRDEMQMLDPADYLDCKVLFSAEGANVLNDGFSDAPFQALHTVPVDQELIDCASAYVNFVRELVVNTGGTLHVEVRVPIDHITGEEGAGGTSDCVIDAPEEFIVGDLKGGKGKVDAYEEVGIDVFTGEPQFEPNPQLAMYADGAITKLRPDLLEKPDHFVRLIIVQPRLNHISEYRITVRELLAFTQKLRDAATAVELNPVHAPDPDRCHFCKANGNCAGQREEILNGFVDVEGNVVVPEVMGPDALGRFYDLIPLMQTAAKGAEAIVRAKLMAGEQVVGKAGPYKLVEGRMGARAWTDAEAAEALVKGFRLKQEEAYTITFKSPTQLEEVLKDSPRRWPKVQALIKQDRCAPSIAPATSKKPAWKPADALEGFTDSAVSETTN